MFWTIVACSFVVFIIILYILSPIIAPKAFQVQGAHVLVTGGSSGIGLGIAKAAAKKGANVTLVARNLVRLTQAREEVEKCCNGSSTQRIQCFSADISQNYGEVEQVIRKAEAHLGPVSMLINSAGAGMSGRFDEIPLEEFRKTMDLNYHGSVYATRAVIKNMKERQNGRIVYVSSMAGQLGLYGYTSYSASKFALRGLAEALQMEVKPYNIYITLAFPPDTDTPGYAEENKTKPEETRLISEVAGLFCPEKVANSILEDSVKGKFLCSVGVDGFLLTNLTCGMSPVTSLMEATQQVVTMGLFRIISLFYLDSFDRVVRRCKVHKVTIVKPKEQ
ncbi:3-ketodihydrosphingosine reductase [Lingula anatina]|uniref:3-dehydrosphinganine reductase n=1 Tax=Lingula anatina TaxID=7574 RepID=A0A1S3HTE5_LINAN|nr:3-ketodihydrosphingosine reductase-like isoform X2 [Lingula anatina]XP_013382181.1 3-ketodihydrosphingosine reductase-like isoform X3 [Lingula anatina]XP_013389307.1 3-ketodihydrosphingosine reductase [Lingula anatina]|eukprot:XP_013382180.1 3-ketodihydrosphingosine reductase-like isoform X2 [Lingula anatina]